MKKIAKKFDLVNFIISRLKEKNLIARIYYSLSPEYSFPFYRYVAKIKIHNKSDQSLNYVQGISFLSPNEALIKCLVEAGERISASMYINETIPLNHEKIATGTAGGSTETQAKLNAIYETIEHDSTMTFYYGKLPGYRISVKSIVNAKIREIIAKCHQNNIEIILIDVTTDLLVPTFICIAKSIKGKFVLSFGAKTSLVVNRAIIGSIGEAIANRSWLKSNHKIVQHNKSPGKKFTFVDRAFIWMNKKNYSRVNFLINQKAMPLLFRKKIEFRGIKKEFNAVVEMLKSKKFEISSINITSSFFNNENGLYFYKVLIPGLQPHIFEKNTQNILPDRIKTVSRYLRIKSFEINTFPHPFI